MLDIVIVSPTVRAGDTVVLAGPTAAVLAAVDGDQTEMLTNRERTRSDAFRNPADAADYVAAHLLVRRAAARISGRPVTGLTVRQTCPTCGQVGHGPPRFEEEPRLYASLAHTKGYVIAAASVAAVGVDAERADRRFGLVEVAGQVLSPTELSAVRADPDPDGAALRLWVRKECLVKLGVATLDTVRTVDTPAPPVPTAAALHRTAWRGHTVLEWLAAREEADRDATVALAAVCARPPDGVETVT